MKWSIFSLMQQRQSIEDAIRIEMIKARPDRNLLSRLRRRNQLVRDHLIRRMPGLGLPQPA